MFNTNLKNLTGCLRISKIKRWSAVELDAGVSYFGAVTYGNGKFSGSPTISFPLTSP